MDPVLDFNILKSRTGLNKFMKNAQLKSQTTRPGHSNDPALSESFSQNQPIAKKVYTQFELMNDHKTYVTEINRIMDKMSKELPVVLESVKSMAEAYNGYSKKVILHDRASALGQCLEQLAAFQQLYGDSCAKLNFALISGFNMRLKSSSPEELNTAKEKKKRFDRACVNYDAALTKVQNTKQTAKSAKKHSTKKVEEAEREKTLHYQQFVKVGHDTLGHIEETNQANECELLEHFLLYYDSFKTFFTKGSQFFTRTEDTVQNIKENLKQQKQQVQKRKAGRQQRSAQPFNQALVFGVPLPTLVSTEQTLVPNIVTQCIQWIDENALTVEGIYRVSGFKTQLDSIKQSFDQVPDMDIRSASVGLQAPKDAHLVTGLLKSFISSLPDPLLTFKLYSEFIKLNDANDKAGQLLQVLRKLPKENQRLLHALLLHLRNVFAHQSSNKMGPENMATIFAPTVLYEQQPNVETMVEDIGKAKAVVLLVFQNMEQVLAILEPSAPQAGARSATEEASYEGDTEAKPHHSLAHQLAHATTFTASGTQLVSAKWQHSQPGLSQSLPDFLSTRHAPPPSPPPEPEEDEDAPPSYFELDTPVVVEEPPPPFEEAVPPVAMATPKVPEEPQDAAQSSGAEEMESMDEGGPGFSKLMLLAPSMNELVESMYTFILVCNDQQNHRPWGGYPPNSTEYQQIIQDLQDQLSSELKDVALAIKNMYTALQNYKQALSKLPSSYPNKHEDDNRVSQLEDVFKEVQEVVHVLITKVKQVNQQPTDSSQRLALQLTNRAYLKAVAKMLYVYDDLQRREDMGAVVTETQNVANVTSQMLRAIFSGAFASFDDLCPSFVEKVELLIQLVNDKLMDFSRSETRLKVTKCTNLMRGIATELITQAKVVYHAMIDGDYESQQDVDSQKEILNNTTKRLVQALRVISTLFENPFIRASTNMDESQLFQLAYQKLQGAISKYTGVESSGSKGELLKQAVNMARELQELAVHQESNSTEQNIEAYENFTTCIAEVDSIVQFAMEDCILNNISSILETDQQSAINFGMQLHSYVGCSRTYSHHIKLNSILLALNSKLVGILGDKVTDQQLNGGEAVFELVEVFSGMMDVFMSYQSNSSSFEE